MSAKIALPTVASLPAHAPTRVRILTAGVEALHSEGLTALTQQAVAKKAGVRQSHITYYFPTRLDLLQAVAQFGCESMMQPISNAALSGKLDYTQFRDLLLPDVSDRAWWRLMTALVNACAESENIRTWIVEFDAQIRERLRMGFSAFEIHLSELDVECLHATYIGALTLDMQQLTDGSQARAREVVGATIDLIVEKAIQTQKLSTKENKALSQRMTSPPPRPRIRKAKAFAQGADISTLKAKKK